MIEIQNCWNANYQGTHTRNDNENKKGAAKTTPFIGETLNELFSNLRECASINKNNTFQEKSPFFICRET